VALWETFAGRKAVNLDWHLAFNALRIKLVMVRLPAMLVASGQITPDQARQLTEKDDMQWLGGVLDAPADPYESRWPSWDV